MSITSINPHGSLNRIMDRLACPRCGRQLDWQAACLRCESCDTSYPVDKGIADLREGLGGDDDVVTQWNEHWDAGKQRTLSQQFFRLYRKAVFARTVQYYVNRYFDRGGVFVEAGSGTAETSGRIDKCGSQRTLVAVDAIVPVLEDCDPIMDVRIAANIFHLPFREGSIDGIWNVGVMEHFTHEEIERILYEFHRVLKTKGIVILLWPATNSIPQKLLRLTERVVNRMNPDGEFRFHPPEISLLRSVKEGRQMLGRNGFEARQIDFGFRSLMAFRTVIGEKG